MFRVGQKVVCVDDFDMRFAHIPGTDRSGGFLPVKGEIYTVSFVGFVKGYNVVKLNELPDRGDNDYGYAASRFRPLVELKDDIAMFKALIAPTPELVVMPDLEHMGSD